MTTKRIAALAVALLAATACNVTAGVAFAANEPAAIAPTPPSIRVVTAERRTLTETLAVTGTILPRQEAAAGTDLNGLTVVQLNADQGDRVKKGQVLALLDRSSLETQLAEVNANRAQAEASIAQARAQISDADIGVRQAQESLDRARALQTRGVNTKAQLDDAVNAADSAAAKKVSAEKALAATEAQLPRNLDDGIALQCEEDHVLFALGQAVCKRGGQR